MWLHLKGFIDKYEIGNESCQATLSKHFKGGFAKQGPICYIWCEIVNASKYDGMLLIIWISTCLLRIYSNIPHIAYYIRKQTTTPNCVYNIYDETADRT